VRGTYRGNWAKVFVTAGLNLTLLVGGGALRRYDYLPAVWDLHGAGLIAFAFFALWTAAFIWLVAKPVGASLRMVLTAPVHRIDYIFLVGIASATISYYSLVYFIILAFDPQAVELAWSTRSAADLLFVSTLTFLTTGFDVMMPIAWWPRLVMLSETLMGLGYLAGLLALLTNRLASEPPKENSPSQLGPPIAEGAAWAGGGAAGAALGSVAGPVGTVVGALVGGALADQAVDRDSEDEC
jgi:hypothetical protein